MPEPLSVERVCDALLRSNSFFSCETETWDFLTKRGKSKLASEGNMLYQRQKQKDAFFYCRKFKKICIYSFRPNVNRHAFSYLEKHQQVFFTAFF